MVIADTFALLPQTILAQALNFAIVAYVIWRFAIGPLVKTVDERQARIAEGLQNAEEVKLRLEEAEAEKADTLRAASLEAQRIVKEAQGQAQTMIDRATGDARRQADEVVARAEESIAAERRKMVADARSEVARLVLTTSSRVLDRELTDEERERYSRSASEELARN